MVPRPVPGSVPHSWDDLVYRCDGCGIGWSNAREPRIRRRLTRAPEMNVPPQVRDGLNEVLVAAVNVRNRASKRWKFCSDRSEDAVTWTVVRGLQQLGRVDALLPADAHSRYSDAPSVLLWGAPTGDPGATGLADRLARISKQLGERPTSRTEPDVVVEWPDLVAVVEAKLGSTNDRKPAEYRGWDLYVDGTFTAPAATVGGTGLYELVRNWRIGSELAGERRFVLVNLGTADLNDDDAALRAVITESSSGRIVARTWADVLQETGGWLRAYGEAMRLIKPSTG